jgi:uncharacterized membrane-anchored protein YjiN (DUF445 family)
VSTSLALPESDEQRRAALRRMRFVATGLLAFAALVFVLTHGRDGVWGYVNAASEAAMVGAVADWFAVTALFRHPLGLKVPHTAIIPTRKDQLGKSLEEFVGSNFLTPELVTERIGQAEIPRRLGEWIERPGNAERVVADAAPALCRAVETLDDDEVRHFLDTVLLPRLRREPIGELAGHLLEGIVADGTHHGFVDVCVTEMHVWVSENKEAVSRIVGAKAPWWSPQWLDDAVVDRIHLEIVKWLAEVRDTPNHNMRKAIDAFLARAAHDLQHDERTQEQAENIKERFLDHPSVADSAIALWGSVRRMLTDALLDEQGALRERMVEHLRALGVRLQHDEALRASVERRLESGAATFVTSYGHEITTLISSTVERWDAQDASDRIETFVGRDLQFIRINGTVVGGLVGLFIHAVSQLLP